MRLVLIAALFTGWYSCGCAEEPASKSSDGSHAIKSEPLRVMTWNLEWFFDDNSGDNFSDLAKEKSSPSRNQWNWKRDAIADSIASSKPSILGLQEVENRRVLWYLTRAMTRKHKLEYHEIGIEGRDHYTEQDVGFLFRPPVEVLSATQNMYPKRLRSTNQYFDLSKHVVAVFEFPTGSSHETVTVVNIHFRARPEAADKRIRQARLLHLWLKETITQGQNVIVLGDFNTEFKGNQTSNDDEIGIACGLETPILSDDLIDLHLNIPTPNRNTHLLGGQYDRILCSRSLVDDDPSRPDLVFSKIEVLHDLAIRNGKDTPEQHWENYWKIPDVDRDLSDHYPVMATFEVR